MTKTIRYTKHGKEVLGSPAGQESWPGERQPADSERSGADEALESFLQAGMTDGPNTDVSGREANVLWVFSLHWKAGPLWTVRRAAEPHQGDYHHPLAGSTPPARFPVVPLAPDELPRVGPPGSLMLMRGDPDVFPEQLVRTNAIPAEALEYRQELTGGKGGWKEIPDWWRKSEVEVGR